MSILNPPETEIVSFSNKRLTVKLVLSEADGEIGIYKTVLAQTAQEEEDVLEKGNPVGTDARRIAVRVLHLMLYPLLIACVTSQEGFDHWPITFDEFRVLPEDLIMDWETKTVKLNPHWRPGGELKALKRKKVIRSTTAPSST